MSTVSLEIPTEWTMADLQHYLDGIPAERIRLRPWPGTATVQDVVELDVHHDRLCELIDGILVEKAMGFEESWIASNLIILIGRYLQENRIGIVTGADGMIQLFPSQVRIPDVAVFTWDRLPDGEVPHEPVPNLVPDLAIEVLSTCNTPKEIRRKLEEYFQAGVSLVWYVDPKTRTVFVHTVSMTRLNWMTPRRFPANRYCQVLSFPFERYLNIPENLNRTKARGVAECPYCVNQRNSTAMSKTCGPWANCPRTYLPYAS